MTPTPDIPSWARAYEDIPMKVGGRDRTGCDCWGLAWLIYSEIWDVHLPSTLEYERLDPRQLETLILRGLQQYFVAVDTPQMGDLIQLKRRRRRRAVHLGLMVTSEHFIHVTLGTPAVIESIHGDWRGRIHGFFRLRESRDLFSPRDRVRADELNEKFHAALRADRRG